MKKYLIISIMLISLSGCGQPTISPAPTTTPTITPPASPAVNLTGKAAAKALVTYYLTALNYAAQTGDTKILHQLSDPKCKSCRIADKIDEVYQAGGKSIGEAYTFDLTRVTKAKTGFVLWGSFSILPHKVVDKYGSIISEGKKPLVFGLRVFVDLKNRTIVNWKILGGKL